MSVANNEQLSYFLCSLFVFFFRLRFCFVLLHLVRRISSMSMLFLNKVTFNSIRIFLSIFFLYSFSSSFNNTQYQHGKLVFPKNISQSWSSMRSLSVLPSATSFLSIYCALQHDLFPFTLTIIYTLSALDTLDLVQQYCSWRMK